MVVYNGKCVNLKITTYKVVFQTVEINNILVGKIPIVIVDIYNKK